MEARKWLGGSLLILAVIISYAAVRNAGFVWDDDSFLTQNPLIKASDGLRRFWFTAEPVDYWPVTSSSLWLEWRLWGLNPLGYHVTNVLLHAVETVLLWRILARLRVPGAFLAAAIFAVHPVNVESVAWITQRKNLMAMLFYEISIIFFLSAQDSPRAGTRRRPWAAGAFYWLSLTAFVLAMLGKGSVAMLPLVLLGIVAWRRPLTRKDLMRMTPFFAAAAALVFVNFKFTVHAADAVARSAGFVERLLGAGAAVWFYLYKALLPLHLMFVYPMWRVRVSDPIWWLPLGAAVCLTVLLWRMRRKWGRGPLFAWGYFCVTLAPVLGFADVYFMRYSLVSDHYGHLALIAPIAAVAAGFSAWRVTVSGFFLRAADFGALAVLASLAWLTSRQCAMYADAETLWRTTIAMNPECGMARGNLGGILFRTGRLDEAIAQYEAALAARSYSNTAEAEYNLACALQAKPGRSGEAIAHFEEALRLRPAYAEAHYNLGRSLETEPGRLPQAVAQYEEALSLKPDFVAAHYSLGAALQATPGRLDDAIAQYEEALRLKPDLFQAQYGLGFALSTAPGRMKDAVVHYQEALRLRPDSAETHFNLACILQAMPGRLDDAVAQYEEALRLRPDYAEADSNLGNALDSLGRTPEAIPLYEKAVRLEPDNAVLHLNFGILLLKIPGRTPDAVAQFREAERLEPGNENVRRVLGRIQPQ